MAPARPATLVISRRLPAPVEQRAAKSYSVRLNADDEPYTADRLLVLAAGADGLLVCPGNTVDAALIARLPDTVKIVATYSVGYDHIDVKAAAKRGLVVTNTPEVLTDATADTAILLMLAAARRAGEGERVIRAGQWDGWKPTQLLGTHITGKRLGILGMGRIGQALARRARAFGLSIHYHNRRRLPAAVEEALEATYWDSLDQMLARMDIVSVNCPHTPATYHLLSARRLKYLRPEAIVVNTARGEVIDENALTRMLEADELAGAGLDVFEHAPAVSEKLIKLAKRGKVTLLPHMGSATKEGRNDMGEKVIINIRTFIDGHRPPDRVLPSML
jgi:glyoxylate reductase